MLALTVVLYNVAVVTRKMYRQERERNSIIDKGNEEEEREKRERRKIDE